MVKKKRKSKIGEIMEEKERKLWRRRENRR